MKIRARNEVECMVNNNIDSADTEMWMDSITVVHLDGRQYGDIRQVTSARDPSPCFLQQLDNLATSDSEWSNANIESPQNLKQQEQRHNVILHNLN